MKPTARVSTTTAKPTTICSSTTTTTPLPVAARRPDVSKGRRVPHGLLDRASSTELQYHKAADILLAIPKTTTRGTVST
jgi:hypothetical protein